MLPSALVLVVIVAVIGIAVMVVSATIVRASKTKDDSAATPKGAPAPDAYMASTSLLSAAERTFLDVLEQAIPPNTRVFVQVALSTLISPRKGSTTWQRDRNRIAQKVADFVLCDQWAKPIAVIELDDSSHKRSKRADRDELLDAIFADVGLRLIHIRASGGYDVDELRELLTGSSRMKITARDLS